MTSDYEFDGGGSGSKTDSIFYKLSKLPLPVESFGACTNARNCKNWKAILGNGYCVTCWDRGLDNRKSKRRMEKEGVESMEDVQEAQEEKYKDSGGYRKPYKSIEFSSLGGSGK